MATAIHCPECGAPAPFRGTAVSLVCEYCGSTVVRDTDSVRLIGKVSALVDTGSPILLGSKGKFEGRPFEVAGRLQVTYPRGRWNEWYLFMAAGRTGWLTDASGQYSIVRELPPDGIHERVPTFNDIEISTALVVAGTEYLVVDRRAASYQGAEGVLPFSAEPGQTFYGVDLRGYDGEFFTLDYGNDPDHHCPTPYSGHAVSLRETELRPLRRFEGWRA